MKVEPVGSPRFDVFWVTLENHSELTQMRSAAYMAYARDIGYALLCEQIETLPPDHRIIVDRQQIGELVAGLDYLADVARQGNVETTVLTQLSGTLRAHMPSTPAPSPGPVHN